MKITVACLALLMLVGVGHGQSVEQIATGKVPQPTGAVAPENAGQPRSSSPNEKREPPRAPMFHSKLFPVAVASGWAAAGLDLATTVHGLGSGRCREGNPVYGPHPAGAKVAAISLGFQGFYTWLSVHVHKRPSANCKVATAMAKCPLASSIYRVMSRRISRVASVSEKQHAPPKFWLQPGQRKSFETRFARDDEEDKQHYDRVQRALESALHDLGILEVENRELLEALETVTPRLRTAYHAITGVSGPIPEVLAEITQAEDVICKARGRV